ncbi:uncharacterized protein LOC111038830 [Myzus persicae]|uniref:uncharacterized protein LOC111038830 n=1 Tax=Myzus persicae TaxID=13164 RepID=UPI000B938A58|nr:uncharacterized protein LOC111038830 [Myzus persicae]
MNFVLFNLFTVLLFRSTSISCIRSNNVNIHSLLPFGQYKLIFKQIKSCNPSHNYKIQHNFYLSHDNKSNVTEIRGTTFNNIPFDDTLFLEANFSFKDADGNWKDNTYIHKSPKACSSFRLLMGAQWTMVMDGLGAKNPTCPLPKGIYNAPGLDTSIFLKTNMPKTFVYGTYKVKFYYTRNKEVCGCCIFILEFKRL